MATIPRAALDVVSAQVNALSADAQEKLMRVLSRIEWTPDNIADCRAIVVEAMQAVMPGYTALAAQASADLYDAVREASVGEALGAVAESGYRPEATDGAVRAGVQKIVDGKPVEAFNDYVLQRADYEIRRAANYCVTANGARDPLKPKYARVPTGAETCDFCLMLASRGFVYHSTSSAAVDHTHYACVLPETNLGAVGVRAGLRRKYEGEVINITTGAGRNLTVTTNHPILTVRGWVDAGHLHNGDALLCRCLSDGNNAGVPDVGDSPTSAHKVFESLNVLSSLLLHRVPVTALDFDGEPVTDGDVEIVDVNGLFEGNLEPVSDEVLSDQPLAGAAPVECGVRFGCPCVLYLLGNGVPSSCCGNMCSSRLGLPLFGGHLGGTDETCGRPVPDCDTGIGEPTNDGRPADAINASKLVDACSTLVALYDSGRCGELLSAHLDSAATESVINGVPPYAELFSYISGLHSGEVEVDHVSVVRHTFYSGHVYNLSTENHWYFANDIVVHNCDCRVICGFPGDEVEDYDPDALYRDWQSSIKSLAAERAERNGTTEGAELSRIMRGYGNAAKAAKKRAKRA